MPELHECERFCAAAALLSPRLAAALMALPDSAKARAQEIRLRLSRPAALTVGGKSVFLSRRGSVATCPPADPYIVDAEDLFESFTRLCNRSVYAHESELRQGYLRLPNGNRAGVCGTLTESGSIRDITSINLRIAREVIGCADTLAKRYAGGGLLIAGPPGSGKTTLLRDLVRQLSDGMVGPYRRITLVDTRGELSAVAPDRVGLNTDILIGYEKAAGLERAVRTLNPEVVAFDEIGTTAEVAAVRDCLNAGVAVLTTAHIGCQADLTARLPVRQLLGSGAISQIALLSPPAGGPITIYEKAQVESLCGCSVRPDSA